MGMVYERVGVIFFSLVFVVLGNQQNIPRIFQDRLLFYRERGAGVYGAWEYWWSISIAPVSTVKDFSTVTMLQCFFRPVFRWIDFVDSTLHLTHFFFCVCSSCCGLLHYAGGAHTFYCFSSQGFL